MAVRNTVGGASFKRCLKWLFRLWRDPSEMAALPSVPIQSGRMANHAVLCMSEKTGKASGFFTHVPDNDGILRPPDPCLEVRAIGNVIVQEFQQCIAFIFLVSDNGASDCKQLVPKRVLHASASVNKGSTYTAD